MSPPQQVGPTGDVPARAVSGGDASGGDASGAVPDAVPGGLPDAVPDAVPDDIVEIEQALSRVAHMLARHRLHDRTVAAAGVPVDRAAVPLLRLLADTGGPMRPGEPAARLAVEAPHVSRLVRRLEKAGYVERVPDARDRRAQPVRLRAEGRDAVERLRAVGRRWMHEALASWSEEERRRLAELVDPAGRDRRAPGS
ncbi:MarR family transcriptional regulator [Actinomadura keratinilytica]|uniref:HTH marR-type domain-containing protein n=1 Tax=Actinomadura keratinilytica TaxID=547461 RepID=A0ABP7ZDJ9_9ACTN